MLIKDWVVTCHFSFAMIIYTFANLTTDMVNTVMPRQKAINN